MLKLCIIGASGLVGNEIFKILEEEVYVTTSIIPQIVDLLEKDKLMIIPVANKSISQTIKFYKKSYKIISIQDALKLNPDITIFSAGSSVSLKYAPLFAKNGFVVDNSSAWRMKKNIKLIIPEININSLNSDDKIISNPNCSTIQMLVGIYPLYLNYGINRIIVSTYQSVSGSGKFSLFQLENERKKIQNLNLLNHQESYDQNNSSYPHPIDLNLIPQIGMFEKNSYTSEEMKIVNESRKILGDNDIKITSTCVRVPIVGAHAESINIELKKEFNLKDIKEILKSSSGCKVLDENNYPMPSNAINSNDVYIGRIRRDETQPKTLNLWIVADNIRKGAATNALQICNYLLDNFF